VTCSLGTIVAGGSATITLTVEVIDSAGAAVINTASVTAAADVTAGNNTATATVHLASAIPTASTTMLLLLAALLGAAAVLVIRRV
jgi:hypothetical protein